ncbi:MAG: riboflavin biosynthesis protein RibF [Elusimicrobia bacterium]|jgi:riboflavin kinase/FMN adenylyltransferase|nr:riboflavin biosynthesis protein RibF [Elusimicrobiota bacterium]
MVGRPVVLTLGTFDGLHLGHQRLLSLARRRARFLKGHVRAVAFNRPPRLFFSPVDSAYLLTTPREKEDLFFHYGVDQVETLSFSPKLAGLSADGFIEDYLIRRWGATEIVVGFNFCFGKGREGDVGFLSRRGKERGIRVHSVPPVKDRKGIVSSGRIRSLIKEGRLTEARHLLGHDYTLEAPVLSGRGMGRRLGFPTANLEVGEDKILPRGVFVVTAVLPTGVERRALLNVGVRPTFPEQNPTRSVEVHLLDFSGDLRGRSLRIRFVKKLRDEKKFSSVKALVTQLLKDEAAARRIPF